MKSIQTLSLLALGTAFAFHASAFAEPLSGDQVTQVKQVIHDYLVSNPQVLVEASQALQKQEAQQVEQKAQSAIGENANVIFADPASPVAGNAKGDVTIVEFFDAQCPHCKDMKPILETLRKNDPNLRIVFKELPIFGNSSRTAAAAALAAYQQGPDKYLQFHNALMDASNPLTTDKVMTIAKSVGLNIDQLNKDMNSDAVKKQIEDNFKLAQSLGLMGTPTFVISKWQVGGSGNSVKQAAFIPGVTSAANLQSLISQARK